jgi:hypothetical protein
MLDLCARVNIILGNYLLHKKKEQGDSEKTPNGSDKSAVLKRTKIAKSRNKIAATIDVKGAMTLAIAVTCFLLVLTYLQTGTNNSSTLFVIVEKKATELLLLDILQSL